MEGYHWASVGSPTETPIVTLLIPPIGAPPPHLPDTPQPLVIDMLCGLRSYVLSLLSS